MDVIDWVLGLAESVPAPVTWALAGLFALLESGLGLGFFVPGETVVLLLAATMPSPLAALGMLAAVVVGASAGDHVGYLIGRSMGGRLRETGLVRRLGQHHWDRAVAVLERRGAAAVFLTRLVPVVRTLTPAAAGVARVPYPRFLLASLAGATTWAALYVGVGFALRASLDVAQEMLGDAVLVLIVVAAGVVAIALAARAVLRRPSVQDRLSRADEALGWRTVPNAITGARILAAVAVAVLAAIDAWPAAATLLALAWASDLVDGRVARATGAVSRLGEALDPLADRIVVLAAATGLVLGQALPLGVAVASVVVDVFVALVAALRARALPRLEASGLARWRTGVQTGALLAMLVGLALQPVSDAAHGVLVGGGFLVSLVGVVLQLVAAARLTTRAAVPVSAA